jgi:uncharacterized membrane protein
LIQKLKTRLTNKKVIMSLASGVLLILVSLGVIDTDVVGKYENLIETILGILVTIGILSDPESHVKE